MSESVERRLLELLGHPVQSPYGNPIPGLAELDSDPAPEDARNLTTLDAVVTDHAVRVTVRRIGEPIQDEQPLMAALARAGARPGSTVKVTRSPGGVLVGSGGEYAELDLAAASHVQVSLG